MINNSSAFYVKVVHPQYSLCFMYLLQLCGQVVQYSHGTCTAKQRKRDEMNYPTLWNILPLEFQRYIFDVFAW